jgi:hypothetical protein
MANTVHCHHCGREIPRPSGPNARCPACHEPITGSEGEVARANVAAAPSGPARWTQSEISASEFPVPADGYEDLALEPDPAASPPPPSPPGRNATQTPPVIRHRSESSLAAARMASVPTFKAASTRGGVPIIPIGAGVVLVIAITAFALNRGRPASQAGAEPPASHPPMTTVGRPPEPPTPPAAEPERSQPVVTVEPPSAGAAAPHERRKATERETPARPAHAREVARSEKTTVNRPAPAAPTPAPAPKAEPESLPLPPPPLPPQFVAAPAQVPPAASAPLSIGPAYAREGYQKARQASPGCVVNSLQRTRDLVGVDGETATVKFAVDETGKVSQFNYLSGPTDDRVANAIWAAVQRCEWVPGATAQGHPITLWVTMPVKFGK